MMRKAKAGHVTGGRVFGYDNVRLDAGHVVRVINDAEAAVVRRIFDLCIKGHGKISIAKHQRRRCPRAALARFFSPSTPVLEPVSKDAESTTVVWAVESL